MYNRCIMALLITLITLTSLSNVNGYNEFEISENLVASNHDFSILDSIFLDVDDEAPRIFDPMLPKSFPRGSFIPFYVNVTDDVEVIEVHMLHDISSLEIGGKNNLTLELYQGDIYRVMIFNPGNNLPEQYSDPGWHNLTFTACDSSGNWAELSNVPFYLKDLYDPIINISDEMIDQHDVYQFRGDQCTDNWKIQNLTWSFEYNQSSVIRYGVNPVFQFDIVGIYPIYVEISDPDDNIASDVFNITVLDTTSPIAVWNDITNYTQGDTITFNGSLSSDNVGVVNWTWIFDYDGGEVRKYGEYANFTFEIPGYYNCTLIVIDEIGNTAFNNFNLTVFDIEIPICDAGRDLVALNGENITFDGSGSQDNSIIVNYKWNFTYQDIEQIFYEEIFSFIFITPGVYIVFLTVWDLFGNLDWDIMNVTITDTNPPIAVINGSTVLLVGERLILDALQSTDNGRIIHYTWNFTYQDEEQHFYLVSCQP